MMFSIDADRILTLDISQEKVVQKASELLQSFNIITEPLAIDDSTLPEQKVLLRRKQIHQKLMVLANCHPERAHEMVEDCTFIIGGTGRVKNVLNSSEKHILSPRLTDGGLSITDFGSEILYGYRTLPLPTEHNRFSPMINPGEGLPLVVIHDDAVEYILRGRNVFHGFIHACDPWLTAGQTCLIVRQNGDLVGHGLSQCNANEALRLKKGIAVRTRSDFSKTIETAK
jgi:archaeosine-15-forming tRNA-guanine transglycosylase